MIDLPAQIIICTAIVPRSPATDQNPIVLDGVQTQNEDTAPTSKNYITNSKYANEQPLGWNIFA